MTTDDPIVRDQLASQRGTDRREAVRRAVRQVVVFAVFLVLLGLLYTGYKAFGAAVDHGQRDWWAVGSFLPRSDDRNMPPLLDILREFGEPPSSQLERAFVYFLIDEALFTLRSAAAGFVLGALLGLAIAVALARSTFAERAFLPYVVASQTVPIIAIAPIIVIWGSQNFDFLPWEWQQWHSVSLIATYLTFFPVAVNGLRGLQSPRASDLELMASYAASWRQTLWRVRLPASLPFLFSAFKIAATSSVVGAIVGELSGAVNGGLGRRVLLEATRFSTGPERMYAAVIASAVLGIAVYLVVAGAERWLLTRQGREVMV